ncbi:hypothetical protein OGH69_16100 [Flavobacterium sp. MFBS3-15]|uniref:hypothetical protein n=1 Tax=Flavobacterium sp. MFBS3-15 TaxID=2989816 RepID=UPI002235D66B|nr:hypothetical protein [Flavobacterium sp. MFBS3-15]MCW4470495.1 hypothetical protein [Flavobacterium sp. MFBS3-15]
MLFFEFLKEYPEIGTASIAIVSGSLGWFINNLFQFFVEKSKYNKELKTFFWKEKLAAAKKASEFYLETINYFNLLKHQFEMYEKGELKHEELNINLQKEIDFYSNKLKTFPHFEHHHINIFYDFDEQRSMEINERTSDINRELIDLMPNIIDTQEEVDRKIRQIKDRTRQLQSNYDELVKIYKKHLKNVRKDIEDYL